MASITQFPAVVNDTTPELLRVQPVEVPSRLKVTGVPESPPVAVGVNVVPTTPGFGAVEVNAIVWGAWTVSGTTTSIVTGALLGALAASPL